MANRGCSLLLRNLRYETTPEKVREIFERIGRVKDVYLPIDHTTREPRGFGFVEYFDEKDAQDAVREFDRYVLDGNELSVIIAQDRRKSPHTMRKILAERQNGRYYRGSPPMGRGPPGRDGYGGSRYDGRQGRYERDRQMYDGGYRGNGDSYGRRGRDGYDDGYGGPDDRRREYKGMDDERRARAGRSRSRSRPYDGYRGDRYRYPPEDARPPRYHDREREDDYSRRPPSGSR
ncbi:RNA binding motif-containing protein, putative [Eimeria tenella]|uniref:RNA binding motif-containing protein, putative n=1 Tax=Eimeria tenella TaxID=5802 RepID=U6KZN3_EIMTE|nr:RNA binding motif-containing protein, putative [Eimeria tenella]CDJ42398.1 RNA binding motif-containing protein, putative [Eimeria tenella]|eukprot:XP_013233148.1 RNA binding motif-containing protein, putative [Eimeria tenella]